MSYVRQIAAALQHAHNERLVHRDVKPENILLGSNNEILLSDFGIAIIVQSTYIGGQDIAGTVAYMAPEQLQGKPRSASDQYALGIIVYEWLCGTRPFNGSSTEVAMQHILAPPPSLRAKVPTIPPEVEQVVLTALAKDPKDRFATVWAFARALEQVYQPKPPVGTTLLTCSGHSGAVYAVAWSPDGSRIISGSENRMVQVWDASTGASLLTYSSLSYTVCTVIWSPDSSYVASAGSEGVEIWDAENGRTLLTYGCYSESERGVAWSPDGTRIASCHADGTVHVWDAATGRCLFTTPRYYVWVRALAWSPDGTRIASCHGDQMVRIWDVATGRSLFNYFYASDKDAEGFDDWDCDTPYPLGDVAWSPDGTRIASTGNAGIEIWDAVTGRTLLTYGDPSKPARTVAWSPDGMRIASTSDRGVKIWDAVTGSPLFFYRNRSRRAYSKAVPPDGTRAFHIIGPWRHSRAYSMTWSPDGTHIASVGEDNAVQVWQAV